MKVTFLGTAHGFADINRYNPSILMESNDKLFVFDCGAPVDYLLVNMKKPLENIRGVFLSHMHNDHLSTLTALLQSFLGWTYNKGVKVFMSEEAGVDALKNWMCAMHIDRKSIESVLDFQIIKKGIIYDDGDFSVESFRTLHMGGTDASPCYAFRIKCGEHYVLYTGDLGPDYSELEEMAGDIHYDLIICDGSHAKITDAYPQLAKLKTDRLAFTHVYWKRMEGWEDVFPKLPFKTTFAADGEFFEFD